MLPDFVRIFVARHVISRDGPFVVADGDPVADAERLLDLDREPGERVAQRLLQREAHDRRHDRGRGQKLRVRERDDGGHGDEERDDRVLHDGRRPLGRVRRPTTD